MLKARAIQIMKFPDINGSRLRGYLLLFNFVFRPNPRARGMKYLLIIQNIVLIKKHSIKLYIIYQITKKNNVSFIVQVINTFPTLPYQNTFFQHECQLQSREQNLKTLIGIQSRHLVFGNNMHVFFKQGFPSSSSKQNNSSLHASITLIPDLVVGHFTSTAP